MTECILETDSYIAVYKPAGMPVETKSFGKRNLESEVLRLIGGRRPGERPYLAVINRLDQPVEGIVLFAKTQKAAACLSGELQSHRMGKEYLAVVRSRKKPAGQGTLTDELRRDGRTNMTSVVPAGTPGGRKAVLEYHILEDGGNGTYLAGIRLLTGRHHQIRVQMAHAGMPVAGDRKYGTDVPDKAGKQLVFPALCAAGLTFEDPDTKETVKITVKPRNPAFLAFSNIEGILK